MNSVYCIYLEFFFATTTKINTNQKYYRLSKPELAFDVMEEMCVAFCMQMYVQTTRLLLNSSMCPTKINS